MNTKKTLRTVSLILGLLIVLALVIYHLPVKQTVSMPVCSVEGEQRQLEMELKCYRHLFGADTVRGSLFLDSVEYRDREYVSKNLLHGDENWFSEWLQSEGLYNGTFYKLPPADFEGPYDAEYYLDIMMNQVFIWNTSPGLDFEQLQLGCIPGTKDGGKGNSYFGPAETEEEAKAIARSFGWDY